LPQSRRLKTPHRTRPARAAWWDNGALSGSWQVQALPAAELRSARAVPDGTTLLSPVINSVYVNTPDCGQGGESYSVNQLGAMVKPLIDKAQNLSVEVDIRNINYLLKRVQSEPFAATFPQENIFDPDACVVGQPLPAGIYSPSVDDGYYASDFTAEARIHL
jgi:hypothetical protein